MSGGAPSNDRRAVLFGLGAVLAWSTVATAFKLASRDTQGLKSPPTTAACLSCHDSEGAAVHASTNSNELGEACAACHGDGKTFSVTGWKIVDGDGVSVRVDLVSGRGRRHRDAARCRRITGVIVPA